MINGFHLQAIPQDHGDNAGPADKRLCSWLSWELDILHNFPATLRDPLKNHLSEAEVDFEKRIRRASYYLISDAVALEGQSQDGWLAPQNLLSLDEGDRRPGSGRDPSFQKHQLVSRNKKASSSTSSWSRP